MIPFAIELALFAGLEITKKHLARKTITSLAKGGVGTIMGLGATRTSIWRTLGFREKGLLRAGLRLSKGKTIRGAYGRAITSSYARGGVASTMQGYHAAGGAINAVFAIPLIGGAASAMTGLANWGQTIPMDEELAATQQYLMPRHAYTQRARAIQAIHNSQLSTRAILGAEADFLHK